MPSPRFSSPAFFALALLLPLLGGCDMYREWRSDKRPAPEPTPTVYCYESLGEIQCSQVPLENMGRFVGTQQAIDDRIANPPAPVVVVPTETTETVVVPVVVDQSATMTNNGSSTGTTTTVIAPAVPLRITP